MTSKGIKWPYKVPFDRKIGKMVIKCQHLPLQDLSQFTQIGIFGLKTFHLAALTATRFSRK
jgi:hypothetical protein